MDFAAVDVETANADFASICQVGIATFSGGQLVEEWCCLIDPEDVFCPVNISIHGIDEVMVAGSPTWRQALPEISSRLNNKIAVCHTHFDRVTITRACERHNTDLCSCVWLDSAKVVRRSWPEFSRCGYGLGNVAKRFGLTYQAHDALEDAKCAGTILLRAITETGIQIEEWLDRVNQPIQQLSSPTPNAEPNPNGELSGEVLVFTGSLSMPRREAAYSAARVGCRVDDGVTKHTTLLVVGDQDLRRLSGSEKSLKHRKAEMLIGKGQPIRIIGESDFAKLIAHCSTDALITS